MSVLLLGPPAEVRQRLTEALRRDGVPVLGTYSRSEATTLADSDSVDTIVVVADRPLVSGATPRQLRTWGNETADWAITTALTAGVRRLVLVCDARGLSFDRRTHTLGWLRELAHRIGYECHINGAEGLVTAPI